MDALVPADVGPPDLASGIADRTPDGPIDGLAVDAPAAIDAPVRDALGAAEGPVSRDVAPAREVMPPADAAGTVLPAGCGRPGQPCCPDLRCPGGCCVAGRCVDEGQGCGAGAAGIVCRGGSCGGCGGVDERCCVNVFSQCTAPLATCSGTFCRGCGGRGQPCCPDTDYCAPELSCLKTSVSSPGVCGTCGGPGENCCFGNRCAGGACCVEGACFPLEGPCGLTGGTCEVTGCSACGAPGQACCAGASCHPDARCPATGPQVCEACGVDGQPCCDGQRCASGNVCAGVLCRACGGEGQPCCRAPGQPGCADATLVCDGTTCSRCGSTGQPCCEGRTCAGAGLACGEHDSKCWPCGGPDQLCCPGPSCRDGGCCVDRRCVASGGECLRGPLGSICKVGTCTGCGHADESCCPTPASSGPMDCLEAGLSCQRRASPYDGCLPCGGPGQPCCAGNSCRNGGCCNTGRCIASGSTCTITAGGRCAAGSCGTCGSAGQACCDGVACTGSGTVCLANVQGQPRCLSCGKVGEACCQDVVRNVTHCDPGLECGADGCQVPR